MKIFISMIITLALLTACGSDPVKEDLINYINNTMKPMSQSETEIMNNYGSVTGDKYKDDETTYKAISEKVVPQYRDFIAKLEAVKPNTKEVQDLHETYISASNKQFNAMVQFMAALEQQDTNLITQANDKLTEGRKEIRDFQSKLEQLAANHKVELKKAT